ncbi:hypothetical protein VTN49DRAFT_2372 [Thermomyces lanuginosus]|uniref:uncharacterized protein n=1 Tax=Thermomyces lanuginosus TaxID=5541 RepID=UPI0037425855
MYHSGYGSPTHAPPSHPYWHYPQQPQHPQPQWHSQPNLPVPGHPPRPATYSSPAVNDGTPPPPLPPRAHTFNTPAHSSPNPNTPSYNSWIPPAGYNPQPPPQVPQQFGHGAPPYYQFQYSNCSGARKALLIGINYIGQPNQLRGCINDVNRMKTFLTESYGYKPEDMVILTDDQSHPLSLPTRANIIRAMQWLVKDARPNDSLFIHFSGHGGRTPDRDGDEDDGFDDVIYPVDYRLAGHIVDDEMHDILVKPLQPGVRLTAVFDSCHSGTALDLPFIYSTQGVVKEPNLAKEAFQDFFGAVEAYQRGDFGGLAMTVIGFIKKASIGGSARKRSLITKTSPADVVMFSGSKDSQTSADTFKGGEARGALSWAFIESLTRNRHQSYLQLLNNIRGLLERKYTQKPQLSCSHPIDVNLLFVM